MCLRCSRRIQCSFNGVRKVDSCNGLDQDALRDGDIRVRIVVVPKVALGFERIYSQGRVLYCMGVECGILVCTRLDVPFV